MKLVVGALALCALMAAAQAITPVGSFVGTWEDKQSGRKYYLCSNSDIASGKRNAFFGIASEKDPNFLVGFGMGMTDGTGFFGKAVYGGPYFASIGWKFENGEWNAVLLNNNTYMTLTSTSSAQPSFDLCFMPYDAQQGSASKYGIPGQWSGIDSWGGNSSFDSSMCLEGLGWYNYPTDGYTGRYKAGTLAENNQIWFGSFSEDDNNEMPTYQGSEFWVLTGPNQAAGYWLDAAPSFRVGRSDPTVYGGKNTLTRKAQNDGYFGAQCAVRQYEYGCPVRNFLGSDILEGQSLAEEYYSGYSVSPSAIASALKGSFQDAEGRNYTFCMDTTSYEVFPFIFFTYTSNGVMPDGYGALAITSDGYHAKGYIFDSSMYFTRINVNLTMPASPKSNSTQSNSTQGPVFDVSMPDWEIYYQLTPGGAGAGYCYVPTSTLSTMYNNIKYSYGSSSSPLGGFFDVTDYNPAMNMSKMATGDLQMCSSGYGEFEATATINGVKDALKGNINQGVFFFSGGIMTGVGNINDETYPESYADGLPSQRGSIMSIATGYNEFKGYGHVPSMNLFGSHPYGYGAIRKGSPNYNSEVYYRDSCTFKMLGNLFCSDYASSPFTAVPMIVYISLGIVIGGSALVALIRSIAN